MNKVYLVEGCYFDDSASITVKAFSSEEKAFELVSLFKSYDKTRPKPPLAEFKNTNLKEYLKSDEYAKFKAWRNNHPAGVPDCDFYRVHEMEIVE